MDNSISSVNQAQTTYSDSITGKPKIMPKDVRVTGSTDTLDLGSNPLSTNDAMNVVVERAMDKLRSVVSDAKAALGISDSDTLDTSAEATGNRIADFALGAFDKWAANHTDVEGDEAKQQFIDFIGSAVKQGISEARDILTSLNSLTSEVDSNINSTWEVIQARFDDFLGKSN